jgi:glycerate kinase
MRVLIVPDKFKRTLTASEAAQAIATGWGHARPGDLIDRLPMSDGGEGFGDVLGELMQAQRMRCVTTDAAGRERVASWWYAPSTHTAVIEAAQANGIALLPAGHYHPFQLDTFGVGALIKAAAEAGARCIYVGLGGSATNDGGFGLARALGWSFLDRNGGELQGWTDLLSLARVRRPLHPLLTKQRLIIAVDVVNPLLGPGGATRVYGPQKGLLDPDVPQSEDCLTQLALLTAREIGHDVAPEPGAGAAGGLGFGLRAFAGGELVPGARVFAAEANLEHRIAGADLVVTAEGCVDEQSFMGKGVGTVAASCERAGKRCLCLAGLVSLPPERVPWSGFSAYGIVPTLTGLDQSQLHAATWLRRLATQVASTFG